MKFISYIYLYIKIHPPLSLSLSFFLNHHQNNEKNHGGYHHCQDLKSSLSSSLAIDWAQFYFSCSLLNIPLIPSRNNDSPKQKEKQRKTNKQYKQSEKEKKSGLKSSQHMGKEKGTERTREKTGGKNNNPTSHLCLIPIQATIPYYT